MSGKHDEIAMVDTWSRHPSITCEIMNKYFYCIFELCKFSPSDITNHNCWRSRPGDGWWGWSWGWWSFREATLHRWSPADSCQISWWRANIEGLVTLDYTENYSSLVLRSWCRMQKMPRPLKSISFWMRENIKMNLFSRLRWERRVSNTCR